MKKIRYIIGDKYTRIGPLVEGYAVKLPHPWRNLHCCVRQLIPVNVWVIDHFETGDKVKALGSSREEAVINLIDYLDNDIGIKKCAEALKKRGINWKPSA